MSRLIGMSTAGVLFALGLLHVDWAGGGRWGTDVTIPKRNGTPLFQPPRTGTLLVAGLLFSAGLVILGRLGLWGAVLPRWVFVAGTAFAWWDTWVFVPLCLLLALGCLVVAVSKG